MFAKRVVDIAPGSPFGPSRVLALSVPGRAPAWFADERFAIDLVRNPVRRLAFLSAILRQVSK